MPDGKFCSRGSLHLIPPVFSFSSSKHDFFSMYPSAVLCRIFSVDYCTYNTCHTRTSSVLRACAEPRRTLARRGGAPLVYSYIFRSMNMKKTKNKNNRNTDFYIFFTRAFIGSIPEDVGNRGESTITKSYQSMWNKQWQNHHKKTKPRRIE